MLLLFFLLRLSCLALFFFFILNFFFKTFFSRQLCLRCLYYLIENSIIKVCNRYVYKLRFNAFVMHQKKRRCAYCVRQKKKICLFLLSKWFVYSCNANLYQCNIIRKSIVCWLLFREFLQLKSLLKIHNLRLNCKFCSQICEHEQCVTRCQINWSWKFF